MTAEAIVQVVLYEFAEKFSQEIANRLDSLARRADTFGPKDREEVLAEIRDIASDYRTYALNAAKNRANAMKETSNA